MAFRIGIAAGRLRVSWLPVIAQTRVVAPMLNSGYIYRGLGERLRYSDSRASLCNIGGMKASNVQQAYSSLSDRYIDLFGSGQHEHPDDLRLIDQHLGHLPGPVLDLGCGPGHLTGYLRSRCPDVTGIDLVPEFIAHARQAHPTAHFEVGSITTSTWADGSVAGALAWYSLIHFEPDELNPVLAEVRRIMAPRGVVVVGFFDGPRCEPFEHKVISAHRWPVDEIARRLAKAGFLEVERLQRPQDDERRPHAAIAAIAA